MRDFRDAKAMAKTLREALQAKSFILTNGESHELIARILGYRDWNVLAARIHASQSLEISAKPNAPIFAGERIPVVPMRDMVLFPHMISRIFVARDKTRLAVEHAIANDRRVIVVAQRRGIEDRPTTLDAIYSTGVVATVVDRQTQVDGGLKVTVSGLQRIEIVGLTDGDFLAAQVKPIKEQGSHSKKAASLSTAVLNAYQNYAEVDFSALPSGSKARFKLPSVGDSSLLADTVAPLLSASIEDKQQLLETRDVVTRLERLIDLMSAGRPKAVA